MKGPTDVIRDHAEDGIGTLTINRAENPIRDDPRFKAAVSRLAEIEREGTPIKTVAYR